MTSEPTATDAAKVQLPRTPNVSEAWRLSAIIAPCAKQALAWPETSPSMIFRAMHVTHSAWLPRQTWHTC